MSGSVSPINFYSKGANNGVCWPFCPEMFLWSLSVGQVVEKEGQITFGKQTVPVENCAQSQWDRRPDRENGLHVKGLRKLIKVISEIVVEVLLVCSKPSSTGHPSDHVTSLTVFHGSHLQKSYQASSLTLSAIFTSTMCSSQTPSFAFPLLSMAFLLPGKPPVLWP